MTDTPLTRIQTILQQQGSCGRPTAAVCTVISGLRDLCDLQPVNDWRRGTGGPQGHGSPRPGLHTSSSNQSLSRFGGGGGHGHGHGSGSPLARNPSNTSLSSSTGGSRPIFRNASNSSHLSAATGSSSPTSPSTPATPAPAPTMPHGPPVGRYQSRFKNSNQPVESKILNNIILSKLNKFSAATYDDIRDFLYQILGSGEPDLAEMIRDFMMLVFRKAASEETYCPLYAKLLAEISGRYKVILEEMEKLQAGYLEIFDDVVEIEGEEMQGHEELVAKNKEKMYRQGYSQFLAELATLEIVRLENLEQTFTKLLTLMRQHGVEEDKRALLEEYADCLLRMSKTLKKKSGPFFVSARARLREVSSEHLTELIEQKEKYQSLTGKAKFNLMDVRDNLL